MKTKEEIIKEAYGNYWDKAKYYVDDNGWLYFANAIILNIQDSDLDKKINLEKRLVVRPKSLQGI